VYGSVGASSIGGAVAGGVSAELGASAGRGGANGLPASGSYADGCAGCVEGWTGAVDGGAATQPAGGVGVHAGFGGTGPHGTSGGVPGVPCPAGG